MTEHTTQSNAPASERASLVTRARLGIRARLRRLKPARLGLLGLLSVPGYAVESLALLKIFGIFYLFFLWVFVGPLVDWLLRRGTDETEPTDWLEMGGWREFAVGLAMLPVTFLNPLVVVQDVFQMLGGFVAYARHRGAVPDADSYDQQVSYRLPFDGPWSVVNGSHEREHSHSWVYVNQRYAYDFVQTDDEGRTRPEDTSAAVDNYYCYDEPVLAPADGVVVDAWDAASEAARGGGFSHPLKRDIRGSYVVIKHADDEYSNLFHLRPGSVEVEPGDRVARGERLGRCGHSGNSSEPHLHFQVQDHPGFEMAASLPVQFDDVVIEHPAVGEAGSGEGTTERQHDRSHISAGQRVTHVESGKSTGRPGSEPGLVDESPAQPVVETPAADSGLVPTLRRTALGVAAGAVVLFVGSSFTSWAPLAALLAGGAALGLVYSVVRARAETYRTRPGALGVPLGLALAGAAVSLSTIAGTGFGPGTLAGVLFVCGFASFVICSEYDRRRLRGTFSPVASP
jgi:hypothetical protein